MKYSQIISFKKYTNLLPYAEANSNHLTRRKECYENNIHVALNVYVRFEDDKTYCRIQCPVNPLPIRGEFETPNIRILKEFLASNGWVELSHTLIPRSIRELEF